ncbi:hypothetical protein [Cylindrospermopsis raciborskii]|uniref:hypothetical protein n=1 Tax=Cylindrospermopsis raciborskii TaxID=77022 RepID=UPI001596A69A|nr:hypothetical protein [Cylindrospermopsis raciborskii]MCZ2202641.1 hypothetical protein [Cylindrospermopsis raciborskii PAMP2012]MCZ2206660.1 hypothetical protein [Cylindrospermopsis raciborskii PAMP2011]
MILVHLKQFATVTNDNLVLYKPLYLHLLDTMALNLYLLRHGDRNHIPEHLRLRPGT